MAGGVRSVVVELVELRIHADGLGLRIELRIQLHLVDQAVLGRLDQGICCCIDQRRGVECSPIPRSTGIGTVPAGHFLVLNEIKDAVSPGAGLVAVLIETHTRIQQRIATRIDRSGPLESEAHIDRLLGLGARGQVEAVHLAVHDRIDDFHEVRVVDLLGRQTHGLLGCLGPVNQQWLSSPPGPGPVGVLGVDITGGLGPHHLQLLLGDVGGSIGRRIAEVVAAEGQHAGNLGVGRSVPEGHWAVSGVIGKHRVLTVEHRPGDPAAVVQNHPAGHTVTVVGRRRPVRQAVQCDGQLRWIGLRTRRPRRSRGARS